jgi:hypothetical protein
MRVFRLLQTRPYWLYKLAALMILVADLLMLGNVFTAENDEILYPVITALLPASSIILGVALLAFLGEFAVYFTRRPRNSTWLHIAFATLIIVFVILSLAVIGPQIQNPRSHVLAVVYNNHMYNLAQDGWGIINFARTQPFALYECDSYGLICHVLDKFTLTTEIYIPPPQRTTLIEMVADDAANAIVIRVDGEVAYTYAL